MKKKLSGLLVVVFLVSLFATWCAPVAFADTQYKSAYTPLNASSNSKKHNIELAIAKLDGTRVSYGDTFSFNDTVGPRTEQKGYLEALNGRGIETLGGGVAQLATTLYLAMRSRTDLTITELKLYEDNFADTYVDSGYDAVITDYAASTDFQFKSDFYGTITINAWMDNKNVTCFLTFEYGVFYGGGTSSAGYAETPIYGSSNKYSNIALASGAVDGTTLGYYDEFSFNDVVGPRKEAYGYRSAINGRGVKVIGGGVAQVASTIYLAVKDMSSITVTEKRTYGDRFTDGYVDDPDDAIVTDYANDIDFAFIYKGSSTLHINMYIDSNDYLVCDIYED